MKLRTVVAMAILALCGIANAQENPNCGKAFGLQVASCQKLLTMQLFQPKSRAAAHKACVAEAREIKGLCLAGTGACTAQCDAALVEHSALCASTFTLSACGGNAACEAQVATLLGACLADAQGEYEACIAGCSGT